jgi:alkyldihydroxyacetonephosphate synthase
METLSSSTALVEELSAIVGPQNVLGQVEGRKKFKGDMSWLAVASYAHGKPLCCQDAVAVPQTSEQVAAIIILANRIKVPVTPFGGGSGVQGAANADKGGILLNLQALTKVRHLDEKSLSCTVEAGYPVKKFEEYLNAKGYTFTHDPSSAEWATIGGCLAARGSGMLSTKYGKIEDHVLTIEFVTPTGEILDTPPIPRHAVPELTQLMIGSEGTLGVITAATVKIRKLPKKRVFGSFSFPDLSSGIEAGRQIIVTGLRPPVMRVYDHDSATQSLSRALNTPFSGPSMLLIFEGDHSAVVEAESEAAFGICQQFGGKDMGGMAAETWWKNRYVFSYPPFWPELPAIWGVPDVVADFSHIEAVYNELTKAVKKSVDSKWGITLHTHFSHWYEWGTMIYPRFKIPKGPDRYEDALAMHNKIFHDAIKAALSAGAVMNDHHGVGMCLAPFMRDQFGTVGMDALRRIKQAWDPNNILCPGKLGL